MPIRAMLLAATMLAAPAAQAQDAAGPYLAARIAGFSNDYATAARYYRQLLRQAAVPTGVLENAVIIYSALGRFDVAADAAARLEAAGLPSRFGQAAQMVQLLADGDGASALALMDAEGVGGALLDGMLKGWIAVSQDDMAGAFQAFDELAQTDSFAPFAHLHRAYALAMAGEYAAAEALLSGDEQGELGLTVRGVEAHVQVLMQLDRGDDALALLAEANAATNSPVLRDLEARVTAGDDIAWDFITEAKHGMAEAYFTLAAILAGESPATFTLINARAALALRADHVDAIVLAGELLDEQAQYELANAVLGQVPPGHPAFFGAEITRAEVLLRSDRQEAAVEVLQGLTRTHPDESSVWTALGDTLRRMDRFAESIEAYDRALSLRPEIEPRDWFLYYARGIGHERVDAFDKAEADFRKALELNPDQPLVLNYLGYSLVEERIKLDEALDMIERAVAARPEDGYITDSLGWVLYRLGRFEEAVEPMERAVQLRPLDPLINDHLGDVLWVVDRKREARFQWRRALSLASDEEEGSEELDLDRVRRKLEVGLDVVLEEEGGAGAIEAAED